MKAFKANKLAFAIAASLGTATAALSPAAHAINLAESNVGEYLIFPYYTVRNGIDSFVTITNTSNRTVIVQIRFREGVNTRDVRDFSIILSPRDVWSASVTRNPDDSAARVQTTDTTCTAPLLPEIGQTPDGKTLRGVDFTDLDYSNPGTGGQNRLDGGPTGLDRTKEGYVEVVVQGVALSEGSETPVNAKHSNGGAPPGCAAIVNKFSNNLAGLQAEFGEPQNVLKGSSSMILVNAGTAVGIDPTVLANFFNPGPGFVDGTSTSNLILSPATPNPLPFNTFPATAVVHSDDADAPIVANFFPDGTDAFSAVLTRRSIINRFSTQDELLADTAWVVTFPTKSAYVDNNALGAVGRLSPFQNPFTGQSCITVFFDFVDREEFNPDLPQNLDFSPRPPGTPARSICFEANVVSFNANDPDDDNTLGSTLAVNINTQEFGVSTGAMELAFRDDTNDPNDLRLVSNEGFEFIGLPVIGFAVTNLENGQVIEDRILNYGRAWDHGYTRQIFDSAGNAVVQYRGALSDLISS